MYVKLAEVLDSWNGSGVFRHSQPNRGWQGGAEIDAESACDNKCLQSTWGLQSDFQMSEAVASASNHLFKCQNLFSQACRLRKDTVYS